MTREDIIRMAREAGMEQDGEMFYSFGNSDEDQDVTIEDLARFARLVEEAATERANLIWVDNCQFLIQAEREACAEIAEKAIYGGRFSPAAAEIRARGRK